MDCFLVFHVNVVFHLVARDAERLGVGGLKHGVETAPEQHTQQNADGQKAAQ